MSAGTIINPVRELGEALLGVEMPARYAGGEYGMLARSDAPFQTAIAFPDLYEIGMSNQALRILYNRLNGLPGISCDRVFAPAPDFEALLRERSMPLYGLDTGIPLKKLDLLLFTLGYELGITSVLTMLDLGGIPIRREDRGEGDPLVIMGGPCVSNPLPYAAFVDAFWIGEAEAGFFELAEKLAALKGNREESSALLSSHPSVWTQGKKEVLRGIDWDFSARPAGAAVFPVPNMKVVQHHGAVEIMRGCPNGCRFCHAGFWYRPMRQKSAAVIMKETEDFIRQGGYREISLSSLSSGDYQHLVPLVDSLCESFSGAHVSFQLPSLRVSSFSLPLLEKISTVRKGGLTFAVETPEESRQAAVNKEVSLDSVTAILAKARGNGWRGAKFYFMIGLPAAPSSDDEAAGITAFIREASRRAGMHFNINVGVFVPKPHTPYQRAPQIGIEEARKILERIRGNLKSMGHRVGVADPLVSLIEGVISRGGEGAAALIEEAWRRGCRLDAWQDNIRKDIWQELLFGKYSDQLSRILRGWGVGEELPWDFVKNGLREDYFDAECSRSTGSVFTSPCTEKCTHPCGICCGDRKIVQNSIQEEVKNLDPPNPVSRNDSQTAPVLQGRPAGTWRILFLFEKTGPAVFQSHLSVVEILSMAFLRSGIPALYSAGFNPLPRLEIAAPLSLGVSSLAEIAALDTEVFFDASLFVNQLNRCLPQGFRLTGAENYFIPGGRKKYSLSPLLWGFEYESPGVPRRKVPREREKEFRQSLGGGRISWLYRLTRLAVLASYPGEAGDAGLPYFDIYRRLYPAL
jgi:radical SAM superfamily enzyme YgiQ (UPF0313 family)